jgi:hypothetical protein
MRTTLKSLAKALGVKKTTLYRLFKAGKLRRHTNTIKPCLRDDNKRERLKYCVAMVDALSVSSEPKFIDTKNIIHIDEKWFNTTKVLHAAGGRRSFENNSKQEFYSKMYAAMCCSTPKIQ